VGQGQGGIQPEGRQALRPAIAAALTLVFVTTSARATVYLSFYGNQGAHIGCYNEAVDQSIVLDVTATLGAEFQGSNRYFGIRSFSNAAYGCNLPDTQSPPGCAGYDITAWFEPGHLIIGHINTIDQNASLEGNEWEGHVPTDFNAIRIEYASGPPCGADARTLVIPIVWSYGPVPTSSSTWGRVKALFR
jgi:hypothetical protein